MSDGFSMTEKDKLAFQMLENDKAVTDSIKRQQQAQNNPYIENSYDFHRFTADPSIKDNLSEKIKEIDKNWVFGNFNRMDEQIIISSEDLITDIDCLLPNMDNKDSKIRNALYRDLFSTITKSRGRGGFAAKLFVTQITSGKNILETEARRKKMFSLNKQQA